MPTSLCAAENPDSNQHQHQPLTPHKARALVASLSRRAEEAIALDMVRDHLELHPATPVVTAQPTACPSPDKKAGTPSTTHPYLFDRSTTSRSGYHFDTDAPSSFPIAVNHTNN